LASCATVPSYTINPTIEPVNINPKESKWLVDEPTGIKVDNHFKYNAMAQYKELLHNNFGTVSTVSDFGLPSLKEMIEKEPKVLDLYLDKTQYDFVIETKIELTRNDIKGLQLEKDETISNEVVIEIKAYSLSNKEIVFQKEYTFTETANPGIVNNADGFIDSCIKTGIKAFSSAYNWNKTAK
jgi:hypothetical protein